MTSGHANMYSHITAKYSVSNASDDLEVPVESDIQRRQPDLHQGDLVYCSWTSTCSRLTAAARLLDPPSVGASSHAPHTSRPGTPIVSSRSSLSLRLGSASRSASRLVSSARPVSRLTCLGTPPEEEEEEEEEDEEVKIKYIQKEESLVTSLSGTSLSSSSGGESNSGFLESPESPTPGSPLFSPQLEDRLRHSVSCFRRLLRSSSRAHTATSLSYRIRHSRYCGCSSGHSIDNIEMVDAKVMYASSQDPTFPPSAMLDGRPDTFWASSGLFPQVVVLTLPGLTSVDSLTILAYNGTYPPPHLSATLYFNYFKSLSARSQNLVLN
nr:uncharacterized protein LOC128689943 [Cherax quadricarinatus]